VIAAVKLLIMKKFTRTRMWELGNKKPDVYTYNEEIAWKKEMEYIDKKPKCKCQEA